MRKILKSQQGQATIEYVLLLVFIMLVGVKGINMFNDFVSKSFGNLAHVLSVHLTVGACKKDCWHEGHQNGYTN